MSVNCIRCVRNKRTGGDLLCDECRPKLLAVQLSVVDVIELAAILNMRIEEVRKEAQKCRDLAAQLRALNVTDGSAHAMDVMAARYDAEAVNTTRLYRVVEKAK